MFSSLFRSPSIPLVSTTTCSRFEYHFFEETL
jgi:hypothetical protein